ncbi:MAG: site-specific integrase [Ruminococcus sp.]|nr:site-specific integrase [Ruminococcus sp.]
MICIKCKREILEDSLYCNYCGKKQEKTKKTTKSRGNGQGTVYKRSSGKWQAEVTLGYYIKDGKRYRRKLTKGGFDKKKDAIAYLAVLFSEKEKKKHITISELWELFKNGKYEKLSDSKKTAYNIAYKKIENELCYRNIDELNVTDLQQIVDEKGSSYYTKRDIKNLLSHLYKIALQDDFCDRNKAAYIILPELNTEEREIFSDSDIKKLWEDYDNSESVITSHILIMLYTGMRPGEILTVKKENVNLMQQFLTGGIKTKKSRNRKIIIPDKILPLIKKLMQESASELLTPYNSDNDFYDDWSAKRTELNLKEKLVPYCCRHTYITRLTSLKISPAMLQELAGHEDYDTTLDYTHLSVAERLAEVNKLL